MIEIFAAGIIGISSGVMIGGFATARKHDEQIQELIQECDKARTEAYMAVETSIRLQRENRDLRESNARLADAQAARVDELSHRKAQQTRRSGIRKAHFAEDE